ncbi:MAG: hypothetical protein CEO40_89 [Parcubacteria group bacterium LiPW_72]|nr:MAG: hypothetical protein CEO40_89 [Parcubacteria group bacterium LiPW_72]
MKKVLHLLAENWFWPILSVVLVYYCGVVIIGVITFIVVVFAPAYLADKIKKVIIRHNLYFI